jgi:hypothetical protein
VNLEHELDDGEVSGIDVRLCLVKSVVKLAAFVKKLLQTGLPDFKFLYELELVCSEKILVPCSSIIGWFLCTSTL